MTPQEIVRRARSLVGVPFRPQGRDPLSAVDCVGVVMSVFAIPAEAVRRDYRLRRHSAKEVERELAQHFRMVSEQTRTAGDVLLCAIRADRAHLAIHCGESFVHADAGRRRVVERPGDPPWPLRAVFRSCPDPKSS